MKNSIYSFFLTTIFCFFFHNTFSQNIEFNKSNFIGKEDGLKEALSNIQKGDELYKNGTTQYYNAINYYVKANAFNSENAMLHYKMGVCYLYSPFKQKALAELEKSKTLNPNVDPSLPYYLGRSYHLRMNWNMAIDEYSKFKKTINISDIPKLEDVNKKIAECNYGIELTKDTLRVSKLPDSLQFKIENLGPQVNSEYPDYRPVISADESILFYTSRRNNTTGESIAEDGKYFEDIYMSSNENEKWTETKNIGEPINRANAHDATCGLSVDGQTLYVYVDDFANGGGNIYSCSQVGHNWSKPKALSSKINSRYHESSASLSPDGRTIYFCSENPKNNFGIGMHDIYKVTLITEKGKTTWSEPENLGNVINTKYDEYSVFIHPDGKTLYFSSEGHSSMGGFDIFKSTYNDSLKKWSKPLNIGFPVNTPDDDVDFVVSASGKHAYYSSIRTGGLGEKDIYRITFPADTTPQLTLVKGNVTDESENPVGSQIEIIDQKTGLVISTQESNTATGKFLVSLPSGKNYKMKVTSDGYLPVEKEFNIPKGEKFKELDLNIKLKRKEQIVTVSGNITDEKNNPLVTNIEIIDNSTGAVIAKTTSDKAGKFLMGIKAGKNYGIVVSADGYLFESVNLDIPPGVDKITMPLFKLKKIEVGKNIVLNNIFFDFNKSSLRPDSKPELERVSKVLKDNPSMKIEISGHTDNKGSATYNLKLSESRAKSVVDFISSEGIDQSRLTFKGYGFLKPIATNETEEGCQKNRRTEFKVLEIDVNALYKSTTTGASSTLDKKLTLPKDLTSMDKNNDGKISANEITKVIDEFFDGESDYTAEKINRIIDFFFEQ